MEQTIHNEHTCEGRLVLVLETRLSEASRETLRSLLENLWEEPEVTWVSGLSHASMLQAYAEGKRRFYNREYVSAEEVVTLMNWREVWLVSGGRAWKMAEA